MMKNSEIPCRMLVDSPGAGPWNMAVDEALLDWAEREQGCVWRFYRWKEPTLSLGYFQQYADRQDHPPSRDCTVVRRASGGGAIMHDRELTYSMAMPLGHPLAKRRAELYRVVHQTLIDLINRHASGASLCEGSQSATPFLCFQRRSSGDVLLGADKVLGSAQRRSKGAVLQHGSVLLSRSDCAPELPGINDLTSMDWTFESLVSEWQPRLADQLGLDWRPDTISTIEQDQATRLVREKYEAAGWTVHRGRKPRPAP